jgi:hypothetical protein
MRAKVKTETPAQYARRQSRAMFVIRVLAMCWMIVCAGLYAWMSSLPPLLDLSRPGSDGLELLIRDFAEWAIDERAAYEVTFAAALAPLALARVLHWLWPVV